MGMRAAPETSAADAMCRLLADDIPGTRLRGFAAKGHVLITGPCGLSHLLTDEQASTLSAWLVEKPNTVTCLAVGAASPDAVK